MKRKERIVTLTQLVACASTAVIELRDLDDNTMTEEQRHDLTRCDRNLAQAINRLNDAYHGRGNHDSTGCDDFKGEEL